MKDITQGELLRYAVKFGLEFAVELQLRNVRSVRWYDTQSHIDGLHEYGLHVPHELAVKCGMENSPRLAMEKLVTQDPGRSHETTMYFLRAHSNEYHEPQPGVHRAIMLWTSERVGDSVLNFYPEIHHALFEITIPE